jgi:tRNA nucleotidyltransferase (CCA-adding enzyme)
MFIKNSNLDFLQANPNIYKCNKRIGKYLEKHGFPVLGKVKETDEYYFAKTQQLNEKLENLPFWLKLFQ